MSRLDDLVATNPLPSWRGAAWLVVALIAAALVWGQVAKLDEVATAPGEIVPQGQVKVIQHLEGGIIRRIDVVEGQRVDPGDSLVALELGTGAMHSAEILVQLDGLLLRRARLQAEADGSEPAYPPDVAARRADLLTGERETYRTRREQLASRIAVLEGQRAQRMFALRELEAKRAMTANNLRLARKRLGMSRQLLKDKLTPEMDHLALESEVSELAGRLAQIKQEAPKLKAAIAEAVDRGREARSDVARAAAEDLAQAELAIARYREQLTRAAGQDNRAVVRSPIDGVVKNLRYHTIGGVVGPGDPIMEIVPSDEALVVEVRLDPVDVGYVAAGQRAVVMVSAYDFVRYGGLDGRVINVAADSSSDQRGPPYYRVVVRTDRSYLGDRPGALPIIPGMQASVDIHTGSRSVLNYLVAPVLKLRHEAFRER